MKPEGEKEAVMDYVGEVVRGLGYDTSEYVFNLSLSDILLEGIIEVYGPDCLNISGEEIEKMMLSGIKATSKIDWKNPVKNMIAENLRIRAA